MSANRIQTSFLIVLLLYTLLIFYVFFFFFFNSDPLIIDLSNLGKGSLDSLR